MKKILAVFMLSVLMTGCLGRDIPPDGNVRAFCEAYEPDRDVFQQHVRNHPDTWSEDQLDVVTPIILKSDEHCQ